MNAAGTSPAILEVAPAAHVSTTGRLTLEVPHRIVVAHAVSLAAALGFWAWTDRHLWFFGDEWDFLAQRGLFHARLSIWAPHNEHWSTLPILLWRALFSLVHLTSYWPYLVPLLLAHVALVHVLWRRFLLERANPAIATAAAALMGFLGTGAENLTWAFQIGFVASLLFGVSALEVAERAPRTWRRDGVASALAVAALMCSAVGIATTFGLAVTLATRRSWSQAVRVLAAPVAAFAVWWGLVGRKALTVMHDVVTASVIRHAPGYVWAQLTNALGSGQHALGAVVAVLVAAWLLRRLPAVAKRRPGTLGLVAAALAFYAMTALARDRLGDKTPSRYVYVGVALLLPVAVGALTSWWRRWARRRRLRRVSLAAPLTLLLAFIAANVTIAVTWAAQRTTTVRRDEMQILTSARLLAAGQPVINHYPFPGSGFYAGRLSPSTLLRLLHDGVLPRAPAPTLQQRLYDETYLDVVLTRLPLVRGRFALEGVHGLKVVRDLDGCLSFDPIPGSPVTAVLLAPASHGPSASVIVRAGARAGLMARLVAPSAPWPRNPFASARGDPLTLAPTGADFLDDAAPGTDLLLGLPASSPSQLCGLAAPGAYGGLAMAQTR